MPTCSDIIARAFRKTGIYSPGEIPSDEDMADGLDELQNLYEQWGSNGMFGRLADVYVNSNYEAAPNERVTVSNAAIVTIPVTIADDGEDFPPYEMAFVEVIDPVLVSVTRYLYSAGSWVLISGLTLTGEAPLSHRGRAGLAACLALALAEEFGAQAGGGVMRQAASFKTGLAMKYGADATRTAPDYF